MANCDLRAAKRAGGVVVGHPPPALAPFVDLFWHDDRYRMLSHRELVLPAGAFTLVFDLENGVGVVTGLRSRCIELDTSRVGTVIGVLFRPGGARAFFPGSAEALYNRSAPLDRLWRHGANEICRELSAATSPSACFDILESALKSRIQDDSLLLHPAVERGLREFRLVPHVHRVLEV